MLRYYECEICDYIHPWQWNGDCRDNSNRLTMDVIEPEDIVLTMEDRLTADQETDLEKAVNKAEYDADNTEV